MTDERIRPEIQKLVEREQPVTRAEYEELRMNSWERDALVPNLDVEALTWCVEHCAQNMSVRRTPAITYDDAMATVYAPELLRRLKLADGALAKAEVALHGVDWDPRAIGAQANRMREALAAVRAARHHKP